MKKLSTFLLLFTVLFFALGKGCNKKPKTPGAIIPNVGIPLSKFCAVMDDFKVTPKGGRVSSCAGTIPDEFLETVDDACGAHIEAMRVYYPQWTAGFDGASCDILLLEDDGVLDTIPNYPRPYLVVGGWIKTAGTVMFSPQRTIGVLPGYRNINWQNRHYQFYSLYHEIGEHGKGYLNRGNPPVNEWLRYTSAGDIGDVHPQKPYIESALPDYARTFPALTDSDLNEGLQRAKPIELDEKTAKPFVEYLEQIQRDFLKTKQ